MRYEKPAAQITPLDAADAIFKVSLVGIAWWVLYKELTKEKKSVKYK